MVCKTTPSTQNKEFNTSLNENVIQRSVEFFITLFCVLGVVLQTILDVYNCFTCIVSLYRNDPTPCKIDR